MELVFSESCSGKSIDNNCKVYALFHHVMFQRNNDDNHPAFTKGMKRLIKQDTNEYRPGGSAYDLFYIKCDLDDTHIKTALKRYAKQYHDYEMT
jgi:hypothetical protein